MSTATGTPMCTGMSMTPSRRKRSATALRAIGHLESIKKMVEDDRDCSEVLIQLAAVESAIRSTSRQILRNHMETCVTAAIQQNDEETLSELYRAIDELLKWQVKKRPAEYQPDVFYWNVLPFA